MTSSLGKLFREATTLAALLIAAIVTFGALDRASVARERAAELELPALRASTQDRLIGSIVHAGGLAPRTFAPAFREGDRHTVIWILDLERCAACASGIGHWQRLDNNDDYNLAIVLIGNAVPAVTSYMKMLKRTEVTSMSRDGVFRILGPVLPSTKILVDSMGVVLMADSRTSGQDCGWSVESMLGALAGSVSSRAIRSPK